MENIQTGIKEVIEKDGQKVIRWDRNKKYTKEELAKQREEFVNAAKQGKVICLSDLFCTHGM